MVAIRESLPFLHVAELKDIATKLLLSDRGNKMALILRIAHFLVTGERLVAPQFPKEACAKRGGNYPVQKDGLMLKGAYKNDFKTRQFFKLLIGEHFHFTAFGIDWLNERWMEGCPPTYGMFAEMWE